MLKDEMKWVEEVIKVAVKPLQERIEKLEKKPTAPPEKSAKNKIGELTNG